jgi:hypothetical protein
MNLEELGRRAVACKHFRWMEGMRIQPLDFRIVWFDDGAVGQDGHTSFHWNQIPHAYPDLSDPATLGCLLALVRRAWNRNVAPVYPDSKEALTKLVAALEAAP